MLTRSRGGGGGKRDSKMRDKTNAGENEPRITRMTRIRGRRSGLRFGLLVFEVGEELLEIGAGAEDVEVGVWLDVVDVFIAVGDGLVEPFHRLIGFTGGFIRRGLGLKPEFRWLRRRGAVWKQHVLDCDVRRCGMRAHGKLPERRRALRSLR